MRETVLLVSRPNVDQRRLARVEKVLSDVGGLEVVHTPWGSSTKPGLVLVYGGDGTFLGAARDYAYMKVPFVGVNAGHLGFLTTIEEDSLSEFLAEFIEGQCTTEERVLLDVRCGESHWQVMNDVVLHKSALARLIDISVWQGQDYVGRFRSDGLIFATSTGSTAYSLSAGGPIVDHRLPSVILTPIAPHSLNQRSIVLDGSIELRAESVDSREDLMLSLDGQVAASFPVGSKLLVKRSIDSVTVLRRPCEGRFAPLHTKLGWGGNYEDSRSGRETREASSQCCSCHEGRKEVDSQD